MRATMKYICKKFINHQIKKCLLFRCRHAVVIMQTLNWTNQCPLFMTVRHIFEISEDDHPRTVTHARDIWWTLDFPNAFVSPGVNSRGELVPSHGASRRRLGDKKPTSWSTFSLSKFADMMSLGELQMGTGNLRAVKMRAVKLRVMSCELSVATAYELQQLTSCKLRNSCEFPTRSVSELLPYKNACTFGWNRNIINYKFRRGLCIFIK